VALPGAFITMTHNTTPPPNDPDPYPTPTFSRSPVQWPNVPSVPVPPDVQRATFGSLSDDELKRLMELLDREWEED